MLILEIFNGLKTFLSQCTAVFSISPFSRDWMWSPPCTWRSPARPWFSRSAWSHSLDRLDPFQYSCTRTSLKQNMPIRENEVKRKMASSHLSTHRFWIWTDRYCPQSWSLHLFKFADNNDMATVIVVSGFFVGLQEYQLSANPPTAQKHFQIINVSLNEIITSLAFK